MLPLRRPSLLALPMLLSSYKETANTRPEPSDSQTIRNSQKMIGAHSWAWKHPHPCMQELHRDNGDIAKGKVTFHLGPSKFGTGTDRPICDFGT
jgi:hypothetical protein